MVDRLPRKKLPPRLYLRTREGREPIWVIKDGDSEHSTGYGDGERAKADAALEQYNLTRFRAPDAPCTPDQMTVATALTIYAEEHAPTTAAPARIGYAIQALVPFWGELTVSKITGRTCRLYEKKRRVSAGTVRRELGTLRAALVHCEKEGFLTNAPVVALPEKSEPKDRWLTRQEVARLIRAARADPHTRHVARFILISVYTGTRKADVLRLEFTPSLVGGHFDLERGYLHRKAQTARKTNKRGTAATLPRKLLAHARRWERTSIRFAVEYAGKPVKDIKRAWASIAKRAKVSGASPHTLKHTAITWAMQRGATLTHAAAFFGTSIRTIETTYFHHHPDHQKTAVEAMERR